MHRFDYENFVAIFLRFSSELVLKVCHFGGQNPCLWEYVVVILEQLFHSHKISTQIILS